MYRTSVARIAQGNIAPTEVAHFVLKPNGTFLEPDLAATFARLKNMGAWPKKT